jgi:pimeloyl-ACP methyl ester carboxylesterase
MQARKFQLAARRLSDRLHIDAVVKAKRRLAMKNIYAVAVLFAALSGFLTATSAAPAQNGIKSVVLVHGAFADGSGWKPLADILMKDGYSVRVVQIPETSFADDVAATKRVLDRAGPSVLVGHSYGGAVITESGVHENVKALVYVAAFQPDIGESAKQLVVKIPAATAPFVDVGDKYTEVDPKLFAADFAGDVPKGMAQFMAISQVPISLDSFDGKATVAPWKNKPTFGVVAKDDKVINPDLQRQMYKRTTHAIELPGSHCVYITHPKEIAKLIEKAAAAGK